MDFGSIITAGTITIAAVEGLKILIRKIKKDPEFVFSTAFYAIVVPVLNALTPFVVVFLGLSSTDPILGMSIVEILRYLAQIALASLFTFMGYNQAVKPLKDRAKLVG